MERQAPTRLRGSTSLAQDIEQCRRSRLDQDPHGGAGATGGLPEGADTQVWLATSDDLAATVTGRYFKRRHELRANPAAHEVEAQERFLQAAAELT